MAQPFLWFLILPLLASVCGGVTMRRRSLAGGGLGVRIVGGREEVARDFNPTPCPPGPLTTDDSFAED